MTEGKTTSEYKLTRLVVYIAVAVAVITTLFDMPFTPEGLQEYLTTISESAKDWAAVLGYPVSLAVTGYGLGRNYLKSKQ